MQWYIRKKKGKREEKGNEGRERGNRASRHMHDLAKPLLIPIDAVITKKLSYK